MSTLVHQMKMVRLYPNIKQPRFVHFAGRWKNVLSLLVAFNKTSYECLENRFFSDNLNSKFLKYDNDPNCLDIPKMASEMDFELTMNDEEETSQKHKSHYVRVIYNGESLGICPQSQSEYQKPLNKRSYKIYCPLDEFSAIISQKVVLPSYQAVCARESLPLKELDDDFWRKFIEESKITILKYGFILLVQLAVLGLIIWMKLKSSKEVVVTALDEVFERAQKFHLQRSEAASRVRKFGNNFESGLKI